MVQYIKKKYYFWVPDLIRCQIAGHVPNMLDENKAWSRAHRYFAHENRSEKDQIVLGISHGLFDILQNPADQDDRLLHAPTTGEVAMYGLTSHAQAGNATIPSVWQEHQKNILRVFDWIIFSAQEEYERFTEATA